MWGSFEMALFSVYSERESIVNPAFCGVGVEQGGSVLRELEPGLDSECSAIQDI